MTGAKFTGNPYGCRLTTSASEERDSRRGVQQSLFAAIRAVGYEGSAASSIAWRLIKAARSDMKDSRKCFVELRRQVPETISELRTCAVKVSGSESVASVPARQLLIGDVVAMLDVMLGTVDASTLRPVAAPPASGAKPRAPAPPPLTAEQIRALPPLTDADIDRGRRIGDLAERLIASGVGEDRAYDMAGAEIDAEDGGVV